MFITPFTTPHSNVRFKRKASNLAQASIVTRLNVEPLLSPLTDAVTNIAKKIKILETNINYQFISPLI